MTTSEKTSCGCGGACGGGGNVVSVEDAMSAVVPETDLDVREIPHESRHARVIGVVTALVPGESVVIAAPHDPKPLLNEIDCDVPGDFRTDYLLAGPVVWRAQITRDTCC